MYHTATLLLLALARPRLSVAGTAGYASKFGEIHSPFTGYSLFPHVDVELPNALRVMSAHSDAVATYPISRDTLRHMPARKHVGLSMPLRFGKRPVA